MGQALSPKPKGGTPQPQSRTVLDLLHAMPGSAGLDLLCTDDFLLLPNQIPRKVAIGCLGPLPNNTVGLNLG